MTGADNVCCMDGQESDMMDYELFTMQYYTGATLLPTLDSSHHRLTKAMRT